MQSSGNQRVQNFPFKGFLLRVADETNNNETVGTFRVDDPKMPSAKDMAKLLDCDSDGVDGDHVTHKNANPKSVANLIWSLPEGFSEAKTVRVHGTVVQAKTRYWTGLTSDAIKIDPEGDAAAEGEGSGAAGLTAATAFAGLFALAAAMVA